MENGYQTMEQLGRDIFTKYCHEQIIGCKVLKYSKNENAHWDVSYKVKNINYIGEIKVRVAYMSDSFVNKWLETQKYVNLQSIKKQIETKNNKEYKISYINIFPKDDTIKIYDISTMNDEQKGVASLPRTTYGDQTKVITQIYNCNLDNQIETGLLSPIEFEDNREEETEFPF